MQEAGHENRTLRAGEILQHVDVDGATVLRLNDCHGVFLKAEVTNQPVKGLIHCQQCCGKTESGVLQGLQGM